LLNLSSPEDGGEVVVELKVNLKPKPLTPSAPFAPASPVGPAGPVGPGAPFDPEGPVGPVGQTNAALVIVALRGAPAVTS
jgi:hypothetical protein